MAKIAALSLLLPVFFFFFFFCIAVPSSATIPADESKNVNYVKTSCITTTYPDLCIRCLSSFASQIQQNPRNLAVTALSVTQTRAEFAKSFVSKLARFKNLKHKEVEAVHDCLEEISDTVDRLKKSVEELKHVGGKEKGEEFLWRLNNVQTWVSAALTDENTCMDGFAGKGMNGKIKDSVRAQVVSVAQVTSNALALVNHVASKY